MAAVEFPTAFHYSVDINFLPFGIIDSIVTPRNHWKVTDEA